MLKAVKRTPHVITTKVGMAKTSSDPEVDELKRQFVTVEEESAKLQKDAKAYREAVLKMLTSSHNFGQAYITLLSPMSNEADLPERYPNAVQTIEQMSAYQELITDLKDTVQPELDLIDTRIIAPIKEFNEVIKHAKKAIIKRDHKLIDFDRHNNSFTKLRDKKEKSLKDEQNIFKAEQEYEAALQDYEHYNNLLKTEIPRFLQLTTAFISPLFHSFFYMQLNILYTTYGKLQQFSEGRFDLNQTDIESIYIERLADTHSRIEELTITKRAPPTAKVIAERRAANPPPPRSGSSSLRSPLPPPSLSSRTSTSSFSAAHKPASPLPSKPGSYAPSSIPPKPVIAPKPNLGAKPSFSGKPAPADPPVQASAPPPYTPATSAQPAGVGSVAAAAAAIQARRASDANPPPIKPKLKPAPPPSSQGTYVTALYDFVAQADGDLSFSAGDRIQLVKRTDSEQDWWTGKLNGVEGIFPG
ncbi:hypothetical protein PCANC_16595 [Puccinia coronata f. sp. avenae]|uniref:BAR domain-containing protein n=1 Tax=Puccinia coronata f. sp. avenae TaxID=200324 RepID=A0A2N5SRX9_9BASI|nr:hypothetical protein PCANC_18048 [Puccinia coronata f. sp. avenae]PLW38825.1 hypothetical protein PCANC_16595 [Puccinia coronata f. sp. avenae]